MRQEAWDKAQLERSESDDAKWQAWITELEGIMAEWDRAWGNLPYKLPLKDSTGHECWREYFDDDYSPERAFYDDQSCWT